MCVYAPAKYNYTCIHKYIYIYIYVRTCTHIYIHTKICKHSNICIYEFRCSNLDDPGSSHALSMHAYKNVCTYSHNHFYTYMAHVHINPCVFVFSTRDF